MTPLRLTGIAACVFDAYGTLFDVNSTAAQVKDAQGEKWRPRHGGCGEAGPPCGGGKFRRAKPIACPPPPLCSVLALAS